MSRFAILGRGATTTVTRNSRYCNDFVFIPSHSGCKRSSNYPEFNVERTVRKARVKIANFNFNLSIMLPFPLTSLNFGNYNFGLFRARTEATSRFSSIARRTCRTCRAIAYW